MSVTPTFQGEALLRRWSESSTQGVQVTFALADSGDLEPLKAKTGKRFACVLVEIGDDEQPVPMEPKERLGPYCYQAVKWCGEGEFLRWLAQESRTPERDVGEAFAKTWICAMCRISSRKELDENPVAQKVWHECIAGPYRKWRIARGLE